MQSSGNQNGEIAGTEPFIAYVENVLTPDECKQAEALQVVCYDKGQEKGITMMATTWER